VKISGRRERQAAKTQVVTVPKRADEGVLSEVVHHLVERIGDERAEPSVIPPLVVGIGDYVRTTVYKPIEDQVPAPRRAAHEAPAR
jgi:hypothetical protein